MAPRHLLPDVQAGKPPTRNLRGGPPDPDAAHTADAQDVAVLAVHALRLVQVEREHLQGGGVVAEGGGEAEGGHQAAGAGERPADREGEMLLKTLTILQVLN